MKRTIMISLLLSCIFLLSSCSNAEEYEHIEVFVTQTLEQSEDGLYETTGHMKVNAITKLKEGKHYLASDIKAIEDYFDIDGKYIRTIIKHTSSNKSKITQQYDGEERKEELHEPSTILIPDENMDKFKLVDMTEEDKEMVKEHVLSFISLL